MSKNRSEKRISRPLIYLAALILIVGAVSGFEGGSGISSDPYQISNCTQLQNMSEDLDAHYELVSDVNCSATDTWNYNSTSGNYKGFEPIGTFTGSLDGQGYVIHELYIDRDSTNGVGMFSFVEGNVNNIGLIDADVTGNRNTGGLMGTIHESTATNIFVTGTVSNSKNDIGGVVGELDGGKIRKSYSMADIDGSSSVGGLAGQERSAGDILNSYSTGSVSGSYDVGGLIGSQGYLDVTDSYWDVNTSNQDSSAGGTGLRTVDMNGSAASTNMSFDYSSVWETVESSDNDAETGGYPVLQAIDREEQLRAQGVYNELKTVNISWTDASEDEDGFKIYTNATGDWQQVGTVDAGVEKYQHTSRATSSGMYVCYNVTAYNRFGESEPLNGCKTLN